MGGGGEKQAGRRKSGYPCHQGREEPGKTNSKGEKEGGGRKRRGTNKKPFLRYSGRRDPNGRVGKRGEKGREAISVRLFRIAAWGKF